MKTKHILIAVLILLVGFCATGQPIRGTVLNITDSASINTLSIRTDGEIYLDGDGVPDSIAATVGRTKQLISDSIAANQTPPGGVDTNVQYNNAGSFGGDANFTTDGSGSVDITGDLDVDSIAMNNATITLSPGAGQTSTVRYNEDGGTGEYLQNGWLATGAGTPSNSNFTKATQTVSFTADGDHGHIDLYRVGSEAGSSPIQIEKYYLTTSSDVTSRPLKQVYNNTTSVHRLLANGDQDFEGNDLTDVGILTSGQVNGDNIRLDGNTISTTNTNGDINLSPNGSGNVVLNKAGTIATGSGENTLFTTSGGTTVATLYDVGLFYVNTGNFNVATGNIQVAGADRINNAGKGLLTDLDVDNLNLNGNTISSTSGDITLTPTGNVNISANSLEMSGTEVIDASRNVTANTIIYSSENTDSTFYSTGTFTPEVADASTGGNLASGTFSAVWTRVGNRVTIGYSLDNINTSGMTSGNNVFIRGAFHDALGETRQGNVSTNGVTFSGYLSAVIQPNNTFIRVYETTSGASALPILVSDISSGTADIYITITYITSDY